MITLLFTLQDNQAGVVGIAWIGTVCETRDYRTAIVEYYNNDLNSGEVSGIDPYIAI